MKRSISLSPAMDAKMMELVEALDSNPSHIIETAVRCFLRLPAADRERSVRETHAGKRALTRSGWRAMFWKILAEEMATTDFGAGDPQSQYLMAARKHRGFQVVFLVQNPHDADAGSLIVNVSTSPPWTDTTIHRSREWTFEQLDSVFEAARTVAAWILENESAISGNSTVATRAV